MSFNQTRQVRADHDRAFYARAMAQQQASAGLGGGIVGQGVSQTEYNAYTCSYGSSKPKTLRVELQAETDRWLKDVL